MEIKGYEINRFRIIGFYLCWIHSEVQTNNDFQSSFCFSEDNGIGIKEEYFKNIFVMFKRLHANSKYEGTGLGLATCQKIVENLNGKIMVSSEINKGSTFSFPFPFCSNPAMGFSTAQ